MRNILVDHSVRAYLDVRTPCAILLLRTSTSHYKVGLLCILMPSTAIPRRCYVSIRITYVLICTYMCFEFEQGSRREAMEGTKREGMAASKGGVLQEGAREGWIS